MVEVYDQLTGLLGDTLLAPFDVLTYQDYMREQLILSAEDGDDYGYSSTGKGGFSPNFGGSGGCNPASDAAEIDEEEEIDDEDVDFEDDDFGADFATLEYDEIRD